MTRRYAMAAALAGASTLLCLCLHCEPAAREEAPKVAASPSPDWVDHVQTYCMVPVLPETAAELHASVNGVWGGIGGTDPILTARETVPAVQQRYDTDVRAFVEADHAAGLVVPGVINGLEGFPSLRAVWPNLEDMACRDAQGKPVAVGDQKMLLMCTNNPRWQQWELDFGKRGIDAGADMLLLDTPMSASFISGFLKAGFCPFCMANFERYLNAKFTPEQLRERFGLETFDAEAVVARLAPLQDLADPARRPFNHTSRDDLLFREFIYCQEQASFDTRKALVDALRAYAKAQGRQIALATNASDLGTVNPGGHWIRALMFADLFDLFVYEQNAEPAGMPSDDAAKYPRGRWAAYHKLAYAIYHRRSPAVIHAGAMGRLILPVMKNRSSINTWMEVQSAEAYAANGAYVQYYIEPRAGWRLFLDKCWKDSARHAAFVLDHRDLFDGPLRSGSPLAILFLYNERGRTIPAVCPSYLGFAQALTEGNYPFDVVFAGDGHYVRDRLSSQDLAPYRAIIVPSPLAPTDGQKRVVEAFLKAGGTVVCQEPEALGLRGTPEGLADAPQCLVGQFRVGRGRVLLLGGDVTETWTDDVGSNFLKTYQPALRRKIGDLAEMLGAGSVTSSDGGLVTAFPVLQPERERVVVHLVNCDIDYDQDQIREKTDVPISLARPDFLDGPVEATLYVPDEEPEPLPVLAAAEGFSLTVPHLAVTATVVVSKRSAP
jgi:hypothetical protein